MPRVSDCSKRKQGICGKTCETCFHKSFASHEKAKFWHKEKNLLEPYQVSLGSGKPFWFKCGDCKHDFQTKPNSVTRKQGKSGGPTWCPYCANGPLCEAKDCLVCLDRSFASHPKAEFWCEEKNISDNGEQLIPRHFHKGSEKECFFRCGDCKHIFSAPLYTITNKTQPKWCPFCGGKNLCNDDDCERCFSESFESHERAEFWHKEKNVSDDGIVLTPRNFRMCSDKKAWFECKVCKHDFHTKINSVTKGKNPSWCPFCGGQKLCDDPDCDWCFGHSFASHANSESWSKENFPMTPRNVRLFCKTKFIFECKKCKRSHKCSVAHATNGRGCPFCRYKTEAKVFDFLVTIYPETIRQFSPEWCRNKTTNKLLLFDFCIGKIIIEVDGPQHFIQVSKWKSPETTQEKDRYKEERAKENGYVVIRFLQEEIWNDQTDKWKNDMEQRIREELEKIAE